MRILALTLPALLLAGCAGTPINRPVEVLRYHTDPVARGTVSIEPAAGSPAANADFRAFQDAVAAALSANGYSVTPPGTAQTAARYVATIGIRRGTRLAPDTGPQFSVGVGGGSYGRHTGVGGGVDVPVSGNKLREVVGTELSVNIAERGATGPGVIWEGRGRTEADSRLPDAAPENAARKLTEALFRGFPGESGRTITVK